MKIIMVGKIMKTKLSKKEFKKCEDLINFKYPIYIPKAPDEEFKQAFIADYYFPYIVSTYGRVFSVRRLSGNDIDVHEMVHSIKKSGYHEIALCRWDHKNRKYILIHRLVALMFIPNPYNKPAVNHKDGNKSNNYIWNLEWVTNSENVQHAYSTGLHKIRRGEEIGDNKFTEKQVRELCEFLSSPNNKYPLSYIYTITPISKDMVRNIIRGKSWKHVTCDYDLSSYLNYLSELKNKELNKIHFICNSLESDRFTVKELVEITGKSESAIYGIINHRLHPEIASQYNLSKYKYKL